MKLTYVGIWQGSSTEVWTRQSLLWGMQPFWLSGDLHKEAIEACTLSPWLTKTHTHTHVPHPHIHTPTCSFPQWNNCVPPPAVKPCQCLVSAGIGWVVAGSIRKGQSGSVYSVTLSAGWTHTAGSALSVSAGLIHAGWGFTQTPQREINLFGYILSAVNMVLSHDTFFGKAVQLLQSKVKGVWGQ